MEVDDKEIDPLNLVNPVTIAKSFLKKVEKVFPSFGDTSTMEPNMYEKLFVDKLFKSFQEGVLDYWFEDDDELMDSGMTNF
jgi:hypothetical protein